MIIKTLTIYVDGNQIVGYRLGSAHDVRKSFIFQVHQGKVNQEVIFFMQK